MNRREFALAAAAAAALVSLRTVSGAAPRTPQAAATGKVLTVTPEQFGARGDGIADDTIALERAQRAASFRAGIVAYSKCYRITRGIDALPHVRHVGVTPAAEIINGSPFDPKRPYLRECFHIGNFTTDDIGRYPRFPARSISRDDRIVRMQNASEAGAFSANEFVVIASRARMIALQNSLPLIIEVAKIVRVDGDAGSLEVEYPISTDIEDAEVLKFGAPDMQARCIDDFHIENIKLTGGSISIGAMYNSSLRNLRIGDARNFISINAAVHCVVDNISGDCWNRALEIKLGSLDSHFTNITIKLAPRGGSLETDGVISIGEMARNIYLDNVNIEAARLDRPSLMIAALQYSSGVKMSNVHIKALDTVSGVALALWGGYSAETAVRDCSFSDVSFELGKISRFISWGQIGGPVPPSDNYVNGITFSGDSMSETALFQAGTNNILQNIDMPDGVIRTSPSFRDNTLGFSRKPEAKDAKALAQLNKVRWNDG